MYGHTFLPPKELPAVVGNDAGATLYFGCHEGAPPNFIATKIFEQGTPRYSTHILATAIAPPSRFCSPSPASNSQSSSNYSLAHDNTFSPNGSQSSLFSVPSISGISLCHGQPSPDPSHRDSRAQSPVKAFRPPPSRTGFRTQSPFYRHQTPVSRIQSPVHRLQSPPLGLRSRTPSFAAGGRASVVNTARLPPGRARGLSAVSVDHSLQRLLRRQSKPEDQPESGDCVMGDSDGYNATSPSLEEHHVAHQGSLSHEQHAYQSSGDGWNKSRVPACYEEDTRRSAQGQRHSPEGHKSEPSPPAGSPDSLSTATSNSDPDASSPSSNKTDEPKNDQTLRVLRGILEDEYDLLLGISEPPRDMMDAVSLCLRRLTLSLNRQRSLGCVELLKTPLGNNFTGGKAETITFTSTEGGGGDSPSNTRKRGAISNRDYDDDDVHDEDPDEDGGGASVDPSTVGTRKKIKIENYACPMRKRNPLRHNCRDWEYCSKAPFTSMSALKKHIIKYHCQAALTYKCLRCHATFPRQDDLNLHLLLDPDRMCQIVQRVPSPNLPSDETISYRVAERLRSRSELDWAGLWQILFPQDRYEDIPGSEFEPVVEHHEISHKYSAGQAELLARLSSGLDAVIDKPTGYTPDKSPCDPRALHILKVVNDFMGDILGKTQGQSAPGSSYSRPRRDAAGTLPEVPREISRPPRAFQSPLSVAVSPRPSSTMSTSTTSGPRQHPSRQLQTPARSNGTCSPATSAWQSGTPGASNTWRIPAADTNATQPENFVGVSRFPDVASHSTSLSNLSNHAVAIRGDERQNQGPGGYTFAGPDPVMAHHYDTVSRQGPPLSQFSHPLEIDSPPPPAPNAAALQGYSNETRRGVVDFDSSPSNHPWSAFNVGFPKPGFTASPVPENLTEAELYMYVQNMLAKSRSAELEQNQLGEPSLDSLVMSGRQEEQHQWACPDDHQPARGQPRHGMGGYGSRFKQ